MEILFFFLIAVMRIAQLYSHKRASNIIDNGKTFFHYGGYYQFMSALFSIIMLCVVGFYGIDLITVICAFLSALFFATDLFANLEAVKETKLVICNVFSTGGLLIPCLLGIFLFDEPMGVWQWVGVAVFILSTTLLVSGTEKGKKMSFKTIIMLILVFLANGFIMLVQKYFGVKVPNGNVAMFSFLTFGFNAIILFGCYFVVALSSNKKEGNAKLIEPLNKSLYLFGTILAFALFTINVLVTTLSKTIDSVILFPISSGILMLSSLLVGIVAFKEKLTVKNLIGVICSFASIIIINVL